MTFDKVQDFRALIAVTIRRKPVLKIILLRNFLEIQSFHSKDCPTSPFDHQHKYSQYFQDCMRFPM